MRRPAETPSLAVPIAAFSDGRHQQTLRSDPAALDLDPEAFRDIEVDLTLDVQGHDDGVRRILAQFEVRATATLECDRTLVLFDQPIAGRHAVLFVSPRAASAAGVAPDEEVRPLPDDATTLDLGAAVRETLLLALPMRRVAPGAEDLPIPTAFGQELDDDGTPLDSRWDALRRLRDEGDA